MQFSLAPSPFKTKIVHQIDYFDFDEFIKKHYQKSDFEFCADQESRNDSSHSFSVSKHPMSDYELKRLNKFKSDQRVDFISSTLLNDLCNKGIIPEGQYIVNVSW